MDAFKKSHIIMILISLILDEVVGNHQFYTQRDGPSLTHDIIRNKSAKALVSEALLSARAYAQVVR